MKRVTRIPLTVCVIALALVAVLGGLVYAAHRHPATPRAEHVKTVAATPSDTDSATSADGRSGPHADTGLQQIVDTWATQHGFDATVSVQELDGQQRTATHNQAAPMTTASTYKLFVAYATLHEIEQGAYGPQTVTRTGQTVSAALSKMILQSDNTSAEALGFLVGWDRIDDLAAAIGATHTDINNYSAAGLPENGNKQSTAADLSLLLTKLQQGTLLNNDHTQELLTLMKQQVWRERVPAGVPEGIDVADKPGWLANVQNDAAIVYGPKSTYAIVILTNGSSTTPLADLSRLVYNYLQY